MSHPPAILLQLKQENEHLRNELRSLSASLDEALSKQPRKATNSSSRTLYPVREKELKVLRTRIAHSEKEVSAFREQVSASTPERTAKLEQEITEMQQLSNRRKLPFAHCKEGRRRTGTAWIHSPMHR